jgi:hypothetical protein
LAYFAGQVGGISREKAMGKAKKRVAMRKKSSKRGKASARPARKKAAKRTTTKKAKSKMRQAGRATVKSAAKRKQLPKTAVRKAPRKAPREVVHAPAAEDTIIDVMDEPAPGVITVTEYESVRTTSPDDPEQKNGN